MVSVSGNLLLYYNFFPGKMGRFDISLLKYMSSEEFRILTAVELGMRNHDLVPHKLVAVIANLRYGGAHKILRELTKKRLVAFETWRNVQGFRLTNLGYDFLALRSLASRGAVQSVGNQIGVGKESDIYLALDGEGKDLLKLTQNLGSSLAWQKNWPPILSVIILVFCFKPTIRIYSSASKKILKRWAQYNYSFSVLKT